MTPYKQCNHLKPFDLGDYKNDRSDLKQALKSPDLPFSD